jgi:hypothetical protein
VTLYDSANTSYLNQTEARKQIIPSHLPFRNLQIESATNLADSFETKIITQDPTKSLFTNEETTEEGRLRKTAPVRQ